MPGQKPTAPSLPSGVQIRAQPGGQVSLAGIRKQRDNRLAGIFRALAEGQGCLQGGATGDTNQQALLAGGGATGLASLLVVGFVNLIDDLRVIGGRNESGTNALDLVGTALAAGKDRAGGRFYGDDMDMRIDLFQVAADATDGSTGTDTGDKDVDVVA